MQRQGPEQKRWWVDKKFLSCIKQLFFHVSPGGSPREYRLCVHLPDRSGVDISCPPASVPIPSPEVRACFGGCFVLCVLRADLKGQTCAWTCRQQSSCCLGLRARAGKGAAGDGDMERWGTLGALG